MARTIMDAIDTHTGNKIYFNGHAQATYMADGSTVEDKINAANTRLDNLNLIAVDINDGEPDRSEYVTIHEFNTKINEINGLLDEINGIFAFYINGDEFKSSQDMTWGDWVESQYNEFGYKVSDIHGVTESDLIIADKNYTSQIENGIYVVDLEGNLHDSNTFAGTADDVTGIGLVTDNGSWIVALDEWYSNSEETVWNGNTYSAWGGYGTEVTNCFLNSDDSVAILDFNGEANTDAIIAQLEDAIDEYSQYYTGAPAAEYCRAYSKGYKGVGSWYLPAAGEFNEIALNKDDIDAILIKLGKNSLSQNTHTWSSSQYDIEIAWFYDWDGSCCAGTTKDHDCGVRPICKL